MKPPRARLTRREAALIAAALLLPIPLFAQSGLSVPLPESVSRGLGSLVTVEVTDEHSGSTATGNASENGSDTQRSGKGSLRIKRGSSSSLLLPDGMPTVADVTGAASEQPAGDSGSGGGNTPAGGEPGGDGGDAGSPGNPNPGSGPGSDSGSGTGGGGSGDGSGGGTAADPGLRISLVGQGSAADATVSTGDSGVGVDTGNEGAPSEETGTVEVEITDTGGSSTGVVVTVPGVGAGVPKHSKAP